MRTPRLLLPLLPLTVAALAAVPGTASAATFCVDTTVPCASPLANLASVQDAMEAAEALPSADTIRVGPRPGGHVGSLQYSGGGPLTIAGEGIASTLIVGDSTTALGGVGPDVTVRDLTVRAVDGPAFTGVTLAGGRLERVRVEAPGDSGRAVRVAAGGTIEDSELGAANGTAFVAGAGSPVLRRTVVTGGALAFDEEFAAHRSRFLGGGIRIGGPNGRAVLQDVLVAVDDSETGLEVANGAIDADHVTVVHRDGAAAPGTPGVLAAPGGSLTLESSVVAGFPVALERQGSNDPVGPTDLIARRSSYGFDKVVDSPGSQGGVITLGPGNVDAEGGFVAPGDWRLRGDAPQLDAGLLIGTTALDLPGFARTVDGDGDGEAHTDMGAFEYRRRAPEVALDAPAAAVAGQPVALSATGTDADGEPLTYAWSTGAAGAQVTATLPEGAQTVTVTATDPAGLTATASAVVQVAPAGGTTPPPPPPPADTTAPALSGVKLSKARFARGRHGVAVLQRASAKGTLRLTLSEPARVELRAQRWVTPKGERGRWVAARGGAALALPAGSSLAAFRGSLGARLAPGRYRLVLTATDASGNRGAAARIGFKVTPKT